MSLLFKAPYTSQPQGAVEIDWANPIARELSFAYLPTFDKNIVGNVPPISYASGGNCLQGVGPKGIMVRGGSSRAARWDSTKFEGASNYTVLSLVLDDTGRDLYRNPFDCDVVSVARVFQFRVINLNTLQLIVFNTGGSNYSVTGGTTISATKPVTLAARAQSNVLTVFVDGQSDGTAFASGTLRSIQTSGARLSVGAMARSDTYEQSFSGQIYLALHFARALSDAEIKSLSANPWQIFKPQSRTLWLPGTVAAGGTTDALTSQPITTGAPTLTQAALGQTHALTSQSISTAAPTLATPAIGQIHALTSQAISTSTPTITTPALTAASNVDNLIAQAISAGQITITQATLAQIHVLTSQAIATSAPTISTPTLTAAADFDNLTATDIATGAPTVSSPAIGQVHALTGGAIACGPAMISTGELGQVHALLTQEIVTGVATISTPTVDAPLVAAMPIGTVTFEQLAAAYTFEQLAAAYTFEQLAQAYSFGD